MRARASLVLAGLIVSSFALPRGARADGPTDSPDPKKGPAPETDAAREARVLALLKGEPTGHAETPALPRDPTSEEKATEHALAYLKLAAARFPFRLEAEKRKFDGYTKHDLRFPSAVHTTDESDVVTGHYYEPVAKEKDQKFPGVVIAHHLGGGFEAEELMAAWFAENGLASITISLSGYGERKGKDQGKAGFVATLNPLAMLEGMRQSIADVCRASDVLRARPEVDADHVCVLGVSLGALIAADASALDPRFARTVLVVGGGDIYSLAANAAKERNLEGVAKLAEGVIRKGSEGVDPISLASRLRSADVLMINAEKDEIFPRESTLRLWRKAGYPTIKWFDCGHVGIVNYLPDAFGLALEHLKGSAPRTQAD